MEKVTKQTILRKSLLLECNKAFKMNILQKHMQTLVTRATFMSPEHL